MNGAYERDRSLAGLRPSDRSEHVAVPLLVLSGEDFKPATYDGGRSLEERGDILLSHPQGKREPIPGRHSAIAFESILTEHSLIIPRPCRPEVIRLGDSGAHVFGWPKDSPDYLSGRGAAIRGADQSANRSDRSIAGCPTKS